MYVGRESRITGVYEERGSASDVWGKGGYRYMLRLGWVTNVSEGRGTCVGVGRGSMNTQMH